MKNRIFHPYTPFSRIEEGLPNIVRGEGIFLYDDRGRRYMDVVASWWACALGHGHPAVVAAIRRQAETLQHSILGGLTHPGALELAERLAGMMPTPDRHVLFASDGSSAVEAALKIALQYWYNRGRPEKCRIAGMEEGYHGDSLGALAAGFVEGFHRPFARALPRCPKLPFPEPTADDPAGFRKTREVIEREADRLAAVIVEPLCQGSAGMRMYPAAWLRELADCCREHEVLLIVDEIAMGFWRTGRRFAFEHAGIDPDLVCLGKALTAGATPLSACLVKDTVYETFSDRPEDHTFYHGNTFAGHPIGCAAALAALDVYEEADFRNRAQRLTERLKEGLRAFENKSYVKETRTLGFIGVVELDPAFRAAVPAARRRLIERGFLFRPLGTVFYLMPPFVIEEGQLDDALRALEEVLDETAAGNL